MAQTDHTEEVVLTEPKPAVPDGNAGENIWMRGLWTLVLFALFGIAEMVVVMAAILQFGWMLFAKEKNPQIASFGTSLGNWLAKTARCQTGQSDEKPFPWTKWV